MRTKFERNYYTLKNWFDYIGYDDWSIRYDLGLSSTDLLKQMLIYKYNFTTELNSEPVGSTYANILFSKYILARYKEEAIGYVDIPYCNPFDIAEPTLAEKTAVYEDFTRRFIAQLNLTYERYSKLIELYEANKSDLLNELTTTSISRFNDTPQDGGLFDDDEYTTNITQSSSTVNPSIVSRLAELDATIKNLYTEWSDEFGRLFLNV